MEKSTKGKLFHCFLVVIATLKREEKKIVHTGIGIGLMNIVYKQINSFLKIKTCVGNKIDCSFVKKGEKYQISVSLFQTDTKHVLVPLSRYRGEGGWRIICHLATNLYFEKISYVQCIYGLLNSSSSYHYIKFYMFISRINVGSILKTFCLYVDDDRTSSVNRMVFPQKPSQIYVLQDCMGFILINKQILCQIVLYC